MKELSVKRLFYLILILAVSTMTLLSALAFALTREPTMLVLGLILTTLAALWLIVLMVVFSKRLEQFTNLLCQALDKMIAGQEVPPVADSETLLARIQQRMDRLYGILLAGRRKVDQERRELQELVSDISHQVKTPVSNLRMVTDTLLTKPVTETERLEFLQGIRTQTDKLDFLVDALVKTSRLETGIISLEKRDALLYDTLAQAMSGIVYAAEGKNLSVSVDCPEDLRFAHDPKWTAEALFNILDNAVKYTLPGGRIAVSVEKWEMSVQIRISDTGKGIPEAHQAAIFQRFYREADVHDAPGVGIGLYLTREIISRQGGTITVTSEAGKGSTFTVSMPLS